MKIAIVTGANGQDGSYLSEFLLKKHYTVIGVVRNEHSNQDNLINCKLDSNFRIKYVDLTDKNDTFNLITSYFPDEVYNLAAQSSVGVSFQYPVRTALDTGITAVNLLSSIKSKSPETKFFQASTSELFGSNVDDCIEQTQSELTLKSPKSPYACAKLYSHMMTENYRINHGLFACNGILFNHESERRRSTFVTRKITQAVAKIHCGLQEHLGLGDIGISRDWGYAKDYVEAMWLMLQNNIAKDYTIGTGVTHTLTEFIDTAFKRVNLDYKNHVSCDQSNLRPSDILYSRANCSKIKEDLGWQSSTVFETLVHKMVDYDVSLL